MRPVFFVAALFVTSPLHAGEALARPSGGAWLQAPDPSSVDGRYTLNARLGLGPTTDVTGRFEIEATLDDGRGASCTLSDLISRDGFEN
jgi:hypothetical protein